MLLRFPLLPYFSSALVSVLFFCLSQTSLAMGLDEDGSSTSSSVHGRDPRLEEDIAARRASVFREAERLCGQYIVFEREYYAEMVSIAGQPRSGDYTQKGFFDNIQFAEDLKRRLALKPEPENLLSFLLDSRFVHIDQRKTFIHLLERNRVIFDMLAGKASEGPLYGPTDPRIFKSLRREQQILASIAIDNFQFLNRQILLVWQLVTPHTLQEQTKLKIRASTTLLDMLSGKREDLGHPDEAIMTYFDDTHFRDDKDIHRFDTYVKKQKLTAPVVGWAKAHKLTIEVEDTQYGRSLWDKTWENFSRIKDLPCPEWLDPLPEPRVGVSAEEPSSQPQTSRSRKRKGKKRGTSSRLQGISVAASKTHAPLVPVSQKVEAEATEFSEESPPHGAEKKVPSPEAETEKSEKREEPDASHEESDSHSGESGALQAGTKKRENPEETDKEQEVPTLASSSRDMEKDERQKLDTEQEGPPSRPKGSGLGAERGKREEGRGKRKRAPV